MKNENSSVKRKRYFLAFTVVMVLNIALSVFLLTTTFGQSSKKTFENQPPIVADIAKQNDSPIRISILNVDNSNTSYQVVYYSVENISSKPIRGYVIWAGTDDTGKIISDFYPIKPFQTNIVFTDDLAIERENIKPNTRIPLSVDYVEFEDGSFWGEDTQKQSEQIAGGRAGVETAVDHLKSLFERRETADLDAVLKKKLSDIEVPLSEGIKSKSEKWQKGFQNGYKSIISFLKNEQGKGYDDIIKELDEIKKNIQLVRRQKQ